MGLLEKAVLGEFLRGREPQSRDEQEAVRLFGTPGNYCATQLPKPKYWSCSCSRGLHHYGDHVALLNISGVVEVVARWENKIEPLLSKKEIEDTLGGRGRWWSVAQAGSPRGRLPQDDVERATLARWGMTGDVKFCCVMDHSEMPGLYCTREPDHGGDHIGAYRTSIVARWENLSITTKKLTVGTVAEAPLAFDNPTQIFADIPAITLGGVPLDGWRVADIAPRRPAPRAPIVVTPMTRCADCGTPAGSRPEHKSFCRLKHLPAPEAVRMEAQKAEKQARCSRCGRGAWRQSGKQWCLTCEKEVK